MVPLGAPSGMQSEEKKEALGELLRMAREEAPELWEENLNTLLSLVLKNIGDDEVILYRLNLFIFIYLFIYTTTVILHHVKLHFENYSIIKI